MNAIIFDVEWANCKNKSICQLAFLKIDTETFDIMYEFNEYINPDDKYDYKCISIHGIDSSKTENCRKFDVVWNEIKSHFEDGVVIGHNVRSADLDALKKNLNRYNLDLPNIKYIDTLNLSKQLIPSYEIDNYRLKTLAEYFQYEPTSAHNALADVHINLIVFKHLISNCDSSIDNLYEFFEMTENSKDFIPYMSEKEYIRELTKFLGIIDGIEMDEEINNIEYNFVESWYKKHKNNNQLLALILKNILKDRIITINECELLKGFIIDEMNQYNRAKETSSLIHLNGILDGIIADHVINDEEIYALQSWLNEHEFLKGNYPYDVVIKMITNVLDDGVITDDEKNELLSLFEIVFDPMNQKNVESVTFENKNFVLSGNFMHGTKSDVEKYLISKGGIIQKSVNKKTDYVIVGSLGNDSYSQGTYGSKVKKALEIGKIVLKEEDIYER